MKKILGIAISLVLLSISGDAQTFSETIKTELKFEKVNEANAVMVFNINGNIRVEGYEGVVVLIEVRKKIDGKTDDRLEKGKEEIQLGILDRADTLIVYVKGVCSEFGRTRDKEYRNGQRLRWGYNWSDHGRNNDCEKGYDYKMDFVIKVPRRVHVFASTVNSGDVEITNVTGNVVADNVNGSIRLKNIAGPTIASTINGSVDVDYFSNPSGDSRYYSLNGDINANFHKGLAAELAFKSFNGEFYSSVDEITSLPVRVEKYKKGDGLEFKVNGNRYKVRQGGPLLDFETFNGDVYLREN